MNTAGKNKSPFFTKPWLAQRMMTEMKKLYSIEQLHNFRFKILQLPKRHDWFSGLQLPPQPLSKAGSCGLKWGNVNCLWPHWHSLNNRLRYSLPPFISGMKSRIPILRKRKPVVKPIACAPPAHNPHQQSHGTFGVRWEFKHAILINVNASRVAKSLYTTLRAYSKIEI